MSIIDMKDDRIRQLDSVHNYAKNVKTDLVFLLQSLGWNSEYISKKVDKKIHCPFDKSHLINISKLDDHITRCSSRKNHCPDEIHLPENCNTNPATKVTLDSSLVTSILDNARWMDNNFQSNNKPACLEPHEIIASSQIACNFTRDERKAIYDYLMTQTTSTSFQLDPSTSQMQESTSNKSYLEDLAQSRDMKRRRMKYKVATKSKTYTNVLREVIEHQMSFLNPVSFTTLIEKQDNISEDHEQETSQLDIKYDSRHVKRSRDRYQNDDRHKNKYYRETVQPTGDMHFDHDRKIKKMHGNESHIFKK